MGPNYQCHMGIPQLLPQSHAVLSMYHHTGAVGAWGDVEKPHQDMAFLLIVSSLAIGYKWVFGLATMWMYPHQACLPMLADAVRKLLLLADEGADWPYAYIRMNNVMAHMLLSGIGYIGVMTGDLPSQNACDNCCNVEAGWFAQMG